VVIARVKAAGYPVVTRAELPQYAKSEKDGIAFSVEHNAKVAMVMGPDDILVELVEIPSQKTPLAMHHVHFASPNVPEMRAWYEKVFGAKRTARGSSDAVHLSELTFDAASAPVVGTKGRALDHIGFEVRDLESFAKELQEMGIKLDRAYSQAKFQDLGAIGVVFITDPWGTYIELNEGYRAE
jgi:catechol 2,3-dioxygenase-like lactoylglutathione lyase family enzyme